MNASYPEHFDDGLDLRVLVQRLMARWWWIVISVVVFTALFITAAYLLTPIYRASTVLIPAKSDKDSDSSNSGLGGIGGVASLVGIDLGGADSLTEEALAVLKSRQFTEAFIEDRHLMPVLFAKQWNAATGTWKVDENHRPTPARAFRYFNKRIRTMTQEKKTTLITVNIDWTDRNAAADWANDLVQRLNAEMRRRAISRADSAVGYLEKEFEATTAVATREAIGRLIETQVKQRMLAAVTPEFAFRIIDPAMAPDRDDRYSPNRMLLAIAGPVVGLFVGALLVLAFTAIKSSRTSPLVA